MWQKKNTAEHKEVLDLKTGMHVIPLHHPESGAEHKLQINVGHPCCLHCGHVRPLDGLDQVDVKKLIDDELAMLEQNHTNVLAYAAKHRVPVRGGKR